MDGVLSWIHSDHLHSATVITDATGADIRRLAYRAFGEEAENVGSGEAPTYSYTGKELDNSGLMYYGARYYDPALSRFITPDTLYDRGPQGLNRYSYALNNPIRYNDPSGHFINGPDDEQNPTGDGCVTGSPDNGGEGMVYHKNDDDPSSLHHGSPYINSAGSHRVGPISGGGNVHMPPLSGPGALSKIPAKKIVDTATAAGDVAASILYEPYDWGSTISRWAQGDFSYWDVAGLFPIVSGTGARKVGAVRDVVTNFFQKNPVGAYVAARTFEFHSNFTRKTSRFEPELYDKYLNADSILLGRFYGKIDLDDFGQWFVPQATVLSGNIGYGKHLVENIQRVIDQTSHIYM